MSRVSFDVQKKSKTIKCKRCSSVFHVEDKISWRESKMPCSNCGKLYCVIPETEAQLRILQDQFFDNITDYVISNKIISQMYDILIPYAESLIKKYFRRYIQDAGDIPDIAYMSVCNMITDFLSVREGNKNYKINISFAGQLRLEIIEILFGKKSQGSGVYKLMQKIDVPGLNKSNFSRNVILQLTDGILDSDWKPEIPRKFNPEMYNPENDSYTIRFFKDIQALSLDYDTGENHNGLQLCSIIQSDVMDNLHKNYLIDYLYSLVNSISEFTLDQLQDLKRWIGLYLFLDAGEVYADRFFDKTGLYGKDMYLKTLEILQSALREEITDK